MLIFPQALHIAGGIRMEEDLEGFRKYVAENKGSRKFRQTVELAINFRGIDFTKQDNRLNMSILLPHGRGKANKLTVFATDKDLIAKAERSKISVINGEELDAISKDKVRLNSLLNYDLLAQPSLMPNIAKFLGQFLGPRGKMPKPLLGNVNMEEIANQMSRSVELKNKGKFLPTVHCVIGAEDMDADKIYENVKEIVGSVSKKVGNNRIRSVYVKFTMSKPLRIM